MSVALQTAGRASTAMPPQWVLEADRLDPLKALRARFRLPEAIIYLDGNSLGALPTATAAAMERVVTAEWGADLISSWNQHDWIGAPRRLGDKIARLVGAKSGEVVVSDSTSVNLFKLLAAAMTHQAPRTTILTEPGNFPTDLYIAEGIRGLAPGRVLQTVPVESLANAINADTAIVLLTHVHYKTGRKLDMAALTAAAHAHGALILWDLSHSAGAVEVDLNACDADLAVGCGYKYLNGGPGAPAYLFVAERWQTVLRSPLTGWMGHKTPFEFIDEYTPKDGIDRFLCGTAPILGMAALDVGLEIMAEATAADLVAKSERLSSLFIDVVETLCAGQGLRLVSPRAAADRGSHVSFAHPQAHQICQALIARGVVGDFRAPDVVRFGFTPLYTRYIDVWSAAQILSTVMTGDLWKDPQYSRRSAVT